MKREIRTTSDGSNTLYISALNESYHSHHGAVQEAKHVFIENGLKQIYNSQINILELGFGTGLNVLVTIDEFIKTDKCHVCYYTTIEKYPVTKEEVASLGYAALFENEEIWSVFKKIHECEWNEFTEIIPGFFLRKIQGDFHELHQLGIEPADLVYFDCFGSRAQPDLWEKDLFMKVSNLMRPGGLLTTYASKGSVRRILQELGFKVEKKQGPPGKREMINATKL
ncbi:MAG TPA: peptidase [Chryseobacterium sp.]|nr:peptidase [Chryseobacterium sp.]